MKSQTRPNRRRGSNGAFFVAFLVLFVFSVEIYSQLGTKFQSIAQGQPFVSADTVVFPAGIWPVKASTKSLCQEKSKKLFSMSFSKKVAVFKRDGSVQCPEEKCTQKICEQSLVVSPKEMAKTLKSAGIRVFKAVSGTLPRRRGPSLCGSPTNNINIFYIPAKQEQKAITQGFKSCTIKE